MAEPSRTIPLVTMRSAACPDGGCVLSVDSPPTFVSNNSRRLKIDLGDHVLGKQVAQDGSRRVDTQQLSPKDGEDAQTHNGVYEDGDESGEEGGQGGRLVSADGTEGAPLAVITGRADARIVIVSNCLEVPSGVRSTCVCLGAAEEKRDWLRLTITSISVSPWLSERSFPGSPGSSVDVDLA